MTRRPLSQQYKVIRSNRRKYNSVRTTFTAVGGSGRPSYLHTAISLSKPECNSKSAIELTYSAKTKYFMINRTFNVAVGEVVAPFLIAL